MPKRGHRQQSAAALFSKRRWRIRHVFLFRRTIYTLSEAVRALGIPHGTLRAWFESGEYEAERVTIERREEWRLTWQQLVHIALAQWTLPTIYRALGKDARQNLPYLLQPVGLHAVVPRYHLRMLEMLAARELTDVEGFLSRQLDDLASAESEVLETYIPGFVAAVLFPDEPIQPGGGE